MGMDCEIDDAVFVGADENGTSYTFLDADGGTDMFFSCDVGLGSDWGSHCVNGQYLTVKVFESGATSGVATTAVTDDSDSAPTNDNDMPSVSEVDVEETTDDSGSSRAINSIVSTAAFGIASAVGLVLALLA